jgi:hypothetical protein
MDWMASQRRGAGTQRLAAGLLIAVLLGGGMIGCGGGPEVSLSEARGWSSQRSWDLIDNNDPNFFERMFSLLPDDMAEAADSADTAFEKEAEEAAQTTPPGGLDLLLDRVRTTFVPTIVSATPGLTEGASGIIVLGDLIGPDGQPLTDTVGSQISVDNFLDRLSKSEGVEGQWFIISVTPDKMEEILENAGAVPGQAVKVASYEFIYDPANIYYMELSVSSEPYDPQHMVTYTGNAKLTQVMTRTRVPGLGSGQVKFFYQPFAKEWLENAEETRRRLNDAKELQALAAAEEDD